MKPLMATLLCALMAGCAAPTGIPTQSPPVAPTASYGAVEMTVADGMFRLTAHADQATYRTSDAIAVRAILTYIGTDAAYVPSGSGNGLVAFSLRQLDGTRHLEAAVTDDCVSHPMTPGAAQTIAFFKSGAWSATDPDAAFWTSFLADPLLHLPPGQWAIVAQAAIAGLNCAPPPHDLTASVDITVLP